MTQIVAIASWVVLVHLAIGCASNTHRSSCSSSWAQPTRIEGVPNLHRVSKDLYRSGQPTAHGMKNLKALGIETVVNLRSFHSDRDEIGDTGLGYEHLYMKAWHPEHKEAVRFLQIATDPKRTPVLVHCQHGADRTGTLCALYRIAVQGWTKEEAIREMTEGGYGFHEVWRNLLNWIQRMDIESLRRDAGVEANTEPLSRDRQPRGDSNRSPIISSRDEPQNIEQGMPNGEVNVAHELYHQTLGFDSLLPS